MLSDARQDLIKKIAFRDGEVIISKVAAELGVSLETVRRDINTLCARNVLSKVHGGAVPIKIADYEGHYQKRRNTNMTIKKALGSYAAKMIRNGEVVMFPAGTTVEAVAASCSLNKKLHIITNSISVSEIFGNDKNNRITLSGGHLNAEERFTYGSETQKQLARYRADEAIVSAVGIDENGVMCSSDEEGEIIAQMIKSAERVILVAESNKLSQKSVYRFAQLSDIDEIVTDSIHRIPETLIIALKENNIKLHIVEV